MSGRALLAVAAIVVVAIVAGVRLIDPPSVERLRRLDQRRVEDLSAIKRSVETYYARHLRLPAALAELGEVAPGLSTADPVSHALYSFTITGGRQYQLCAEFALASRTTSTWAPNDPWSHTAGQQCFPVEVK